jgi:hypothetical protein
MCVVLFVWRVICVCDAIVSVVLIYFVFFCLIGRFLSGFGGLVVGHQGVGESEVSVFCSVCIDECPINDFVGNRCRFVEYS